MSFTVKEISAFYRSPLGKYVKEIIANEIDTLIERKSIHQTILGLGYSTPYLQNRDHSHNSVFAFMAENLGAESWPSDGNSKVALIHDWLIPLPNQSVDVALLIHSIEFSNHKSAFLQELWRILKKDGQIIVVVPNRLSTWSSFDKTPFGHGSPFTMGQITHIFLENGFDVDSQKRVLYNLPIQSPFIRSILKPLDILGPYFFKKLSGVNILSLRKKTLLFNPLQSADSTRDEKLSLQTV